MTLRIYGNRASGNCYKIQLCLAHLGRAGDYEWVDVGVLGESRPAELLEHNPTGLVPTVCLTDGTWLFESNAILCHLAEGSSLLPAAGLPRTRVLQWLFFEQNQHEPCIATARYWRSIRKDPAARAEVLPFWDAAGQRALRAMDRHLATAEFFGGAFSLADIALYAYTHVADEAEHDLANYPAVRDWCTRVAALPSHVPMG